MTGKSMLSSNNNFRRRVSVSHKHGGLVVRIERHNDRTTNIVLLLAFTAFFMFVCGVIVAPLFRHSSLRDGLYTLPFLAFVLAWYVVGIRIGTWRTFGVEQIAVEGGALSWTRTALCWVRKVEIPTTDITEVKAIKPWHALSNHVEFVAHNRRHAIGDMLLQDETTELAEQLKHAVGLAR
jgi:membrane protease YdiL (CAAX protease family)